MDFLGGWLGQRTVAVAAFEAMREQRVTYEEAFPGVTIEDA